MKISFKTILRMDYFKVSSKPFFSFWEILFICVLQFYFTIFFFCRRYVSELKRLPLQYLFEPWKAPLAVQKAARCVVGDDYPEPLANHIEQRKICVRRFKDMCNTLNISGR